MRINCTCTTVFMTYLALHREQDVCAANSIVRQEFVMRIAFNLAAAFVSSATIILAVI